MPYFPLLSAI